MLIASIVLAADSPKDAAIIQAEAQVRTLLRTGDYSGALSTATRFAKLPDHFLRRQLLLFDASIHLILRENALDRLHQSFTTLEIPATPEPDDLLAIGRTRELLGDDPRDVIRKFYEPAKKGFPKDAAPLRAIAELALEKEDLALAATNFRAALKLTPDDPDLLAGLAIALIPSDPESAEATLERALKVDPNHFPSLQLKAENLIGRDEFDAAREALDVILKINPRHPEAHAMLAAMALLKSDAKAAAAARSEALASWPGNPEPDYVIGRILASRIRQAEAIEFLNLALRADPGHFDANFTLGSTLLRFGRESEGWPYIEAVFRADPYNIAAFNLLELRDRTAHFTTIERDGIRLRMDPSEAIVYGERAFDLLARARKTLPEKYKVAVPNPVTVEIFGDQRDFAIRTLSMPGGEGFLGVCFGPLITASGPGGRLGRANWEAVLWHEFTHTVTLGATRHRIPRWLTEGISVFEERQNDPRWDFPLTPEIRQILLGTELPPIDKLDAAFRSENMNFAYYYASLAVQFIVEVKGFETLLAILSDLREGKLINDSLAARVAPIDQLRNDFLAYAKAAALSAGPGLDWTPLTPEDQEALVKNPEAWLAKYPDNYWALKYRAGTLVREQNWSAARPILEKLVTLYPDNHDESNPRLHLAEVYRHLGEKALEKSTLEALVALNASELSAYRRLSALAVESGDNPLSAKYADAMLAIDPLDPTTYSSLAANPAAPPATRESAFKSLLALKPADPAAVHYEFARFLADQERPEARRQVLLALEETPLYREALKLLLELHKQSPTTP